MLGWFRCVRFIFFSTVLSDWLGRLAEMTSFMSNET